MGCRRATPVFPPAKPWLPVHPDYPQRNVAAQQADPDSLFNFTRTLLTLRRENPALHAGDYTALETRGKVLAYLRSTPEQAVLVALNFSGHTAEFVPPDGKWQVIFGGDGEAAAATLAPHEVRLLIKEK